MNDQNMFHSLNCSLVQFKLQYVNLKSAFLTLNKLFIAQRFLFHKSGNFMFLDHFYLSINYKSQMFL